MRYTVVSFSVAATQAVNDLITLSGVGVALDKAIVTDWDGTYARVSLIFQHEFITANYVVTSNVFDSATGLIVNETPNLIKRTTDMDIYVHKSRKVDLAIIGF
jgi:hypothetical protein